MNSVLFVCMIAEQKHDWHLQRVPGHAPTNPKVDQPTFRQEELLLLRRFFDLLASWETREKSNVS